MPFDSLAKRLSVLFDSGLTPYPDSLTESIDRSQLINIFSYYTLTPINIWEKSYLGKIYKSLIDILSQLGSVNEDDFNKTSFPLFNIFIDEEVNNLDFDTPNMDAFQNEVTFVIECYNKIPTEVTNSKFIIDSSLDDLLESFINKMNVNNNINNLTMGNYYISSERLQSGNGEDIMMPKKLKINLTVPYSQSKSDPLVPAY
jgi:hypothetical protein